MPYGYSRKRGAVTRRRRVAKRSVKTRKSGLFTKRIDTKVKGTPFGHNSGDSLHVDRPVIGGRGAFPQRLFTKLRYVDNMVLYADNLTGLSGTEIPYRLNSLFDPFFNAGGHQPLGFDQLTPIYQRYKVYKVDVQVRITGKTGASLSYLAVNVRQAGATYQLGGLKAIAEILEQPGNTVMDGNLLQTWNQTIWLHQVEGKTYEGYMAEGNYESLNNANPSLTPFLSLAVGTSDTPASSTNGIYVTVGFVFHAVFMGQNPLAQS